MFDFLDMETIRDTDYLEGNYYRKLPKTPEDHAVLFDYEMVDENSRAYAKMLNELRADTLTCTIKTDYDIGWKVGGYVCTQDGLFWQITEYRKVLQPESNKEALRVVRQSNNTEFVIRLSEKQNPWGLK